MFEKYDATLSQADLLARIEALNADPTIHGILVQMPLPKHINPHRVIETISTSKDVDGYSTLSAGELMTGAARFQSLHALWLHEADRVHRHRLARQTRGRDRSQQYRGQTHGPDAAAEERHRHHLPQCDRRHLKSHTLQADVVVAAVGKRNVLTADMVKPGAIVIDVGMNRNDEGKLCGDVDFAGVRKVAGLHHASTRWRRAR